MPRIIRIAKSRGLLAVFSLFYSGALVAIYFLSWALIFKICLVLLLALDFVRVIKTTVAVDYIIHDIDRWQYQMRGKTYRSKLIKSKTYCANLIIILHLRHLTGAKYILLAKDALTTSDFRYVALRTKY